MKTSILTGLCLSAFLSVYSNDPFTGDNQPAGITNHSTSLVSSAGVDQTIIGPAPSAINHTVTSLVHAPFRITANDTVPESAQFGKVEIEARFNGGEEAWRKYIGANLNPEVPIKKKAPAGVYPVMIQFIVKKDGTVGEVVALTNHGYGMEAEAIRVISGSPRWKPAMQAGKPVNAYRKQPITFEVTEEKRKRKKKDD